MKKIICIVTLMVIAAYFIAGCSQDDGSSSEVNKDYSEYLSLSKPGKIDWALDWDGFSEIDKNTFRLAKKRMDITFEENGICQTKWISSDQVNISDELFDCFINMIDITNKATERLNMIKWTPPRLKVGNVMDNAN
jgi:hypothetical protein